MTPLDGSTSCLPALIDCDDLIIEVDPFDPPVDFNNPLTDHFTGYLRRLSLSHILDSQEAATRSDHLFSTSGGTGSPDRVVYIEPGPDDRGIANAAGDLAKETAGGGNTANIAIRINAEHIDRPGLALVNAIVIVRRSYPIVVLAQVFLPPKPDSARLICQQIFLRKSMCPGKFQSTGADEHGMIRPIHQVVPRCMRV